MKLSTVAAVSVVAVFIMACAASSMVAQDKETKDPNPGQEPEKQEKSKSEFDDALPVAKMPTVWPWQTGEGFWFDFRFSMSEALHDARMHYRQGQLQAAKAEINQAINWLNVAKMTATKTSQAEFATVIESLGEIADQLEASEPVSLLRLNRVFARANLALARHHYAKANESVEDADLANASKRLVAAADHLKRAANSANELPSPIIGTFQDEYNPLGMVDQKFIPTVEKIEDDLEKLGEALKELGGKLIPKPKTEQPKTPDQPKPEARTEKKT